MTFSLFNSLILLALFADMLERRYPDNCKSFIINLSFNCIYIYSKSQILFHKIVKSLKNTISTSQNIVLSNGVYND